jgi:acetyltransferase-like isoleucine patch superfamily enzyme
MSDEEIKKMGFKKIGRSVKISEKASVYDCEKIELDDYARIDDYCILSGKIIVGKYCHITPMCLMAGGEPGIFFDDFVTLAYGVKLFSQSDDYSGESLTNSLIPKKYKREIFASIHLEKHVIIGASRIVMPGVMVAEGCSIGAMSLVNKNTNPWGVYYGIPAKRVRDRKKDMLKFETAFLKDVKNDSI